MDDFVKNLEASLRGLPALVTGLLGAGGLYKLIEKLLDNRDKAAERESKEDGDRAKADAERIKELEAQLIPLAQKAAALEWCQKDNTKLETENKTLHQRVYDLGIELRQSQTVANGYKVISELFDDDEGRAFLRRKMEARREREKAERQQQHGDTQTETPKESDG